MSDRGSPADPAPAVRAGSHPLTDEVLRLVADVRKTASAAGEDLAADALGREIGGVRNGAASVVAVGEKKRGKSSLINALVAFPDLLPVDVDVATCVHLVVSHGDELAVRAVEADGTREIPVGAIAEYAAIDPATRRPGRAGVTTVAVELPSPLLARGLDLVDTPGVGGLLAGHAALTLAALERADALVFVLDGHGEITSSELAFLERATERIATVVFVVTKIDLFPEWPAVVARNQELMARHAPRYADAPWFPVSSRGRMHAQRALAAGRPDAAARHLATSGLAELEAHLGRLAEVADGLRLANVVDQAANLVSRLAAAQVRRARSLTLPPGFTESVEAEKAKLTELQSRSATWRTRLAERTARAEHRARTEFARRLEDFRKELGDVIAAGGSGFFDTVVKDVPLRAEAVWVEMDTVLRRELGEVATALSADLADVDVDLSEVVPDVPPERLAQLPEAARSRGGLSLAEHGVMAMSLGMMVGTLISTIPGMQPVGIAAGIAVVGLFSRRRHQKETAAVHRDDARRYVAEVAGRLATEIPAVIAQAVGGTRELVSGSVAAALAAQKDRLTASLAEHQNDLATEQSVLARKRTEVERVLRELGTMRQDGADLARRLSVGGSEIGDGTRVEPAAEGVP